MTVNNQPIVDQPVVRTTPGRFAVTAVFFLNGLTLSTYIVRAPSFKDAYRLTDGQFGLTGLLFALAALACMQLVGPLTARVGTRAVLRVALAVMPLLLACIAVAPGPGWFTALAPVLGAVHGTTDAAMNTSAVAVERRAGRPVLNGCHAAWSISAVAASLSTTALTHTEVPLAAHLITAGALLLAAGLVLGPRLPDTGRVEAAAGDAAGQDGATGLRSGWSGPLLVLGLTATALMICEGAALGWGGIFLHEERHATLSMAAAAVLTPHPAAAVAGFALAGLGSSVLIPLTFSAVGQLPGTPTATLVSRLTTFTYTGILLGPALIGWSAGQIGLALTMTALIPLPLIVALFPRPPMGTHHSVTPLPRPTQPA